MAIPLVLAVVVTNFVLIHVAPGDPIYFIAGEFGSPEYYEMMRARFGLDRPIHERLLTYLTNVIQGDLGHSLVFRQPVIDIIVERIPATMLLMGTAISLSSLIGIALGVTSSLKPYSIGDNVATCISLVGHSLPVFWLAQMLLIVFALHLGLFPATGMTSLQFEYSGIEHVLDIIYHLALPAASLSISSLALVTRLTRSSMLETLREDYVMTARAKGLNERRVVYVHALRNALLPVVTVSGMRVGFMLAGAVLTETVYGLSLIHISEPTRPY